jgi:hypothetical protein
LSLAKIFQSEQFRRLLTRLKLGKNFASIIPNDFQLATLIFFTVTAVNAAVFRWRGIGRCPEFPSLSFRFSCSLPCSSEFLGSGAHKIISV